MRNHAPNKAKKEKFNQIPDRRTVSPFPQAFGRKTPENLKREVSTRNQVRFDEDTIVFGENDALPLIISNAVDESPAATSCIDTVAQFIKGSGFSDPALMDLIVDKDGTTLWDLHCSLADSLALFWGFSVNFKYNELGKITTAYQLPFESVRFKKPEGNSPYIDTIKYNPYFGTDEYKKEYTTEYPVFNPKEVQNQITKQGLAFNGQVYYYGKLRPRFKFYPVPKYWSAKEAILADHKLQEFHNEELENGFFQSVLINAIGDPNQWSKNPRLMKKELQSDNVTYKETPTKTVGEEFNEQMSESFSGTKKAGTAMVMWSVNSDQAVKIQEFPTGINGDRIIATQDSITKTITIATKVPSILANISEGVSLGSGGSEIQKAIELMQSRTEEFRTRLENFYNKVLLPNLQNAPVNIKAEIQNFNPITQKVEFDKQYWEVLDETEKREFIKKNFPDVTLTKVVVQQPAQPVQPNTPPPNQPPGQTATAMDPQQEAIDSMIRSLPRKEVAKFWGYVNDYRSGRATLEQAKIFLRAFKLTDEQIMLFLNDPEGDGV